MSSNVRGQVLKVAETILRRKLSHLESKYKKIPQVVELLIALATRGKDRYIKKLREVALEFHLYQYDLDTLLQEGFSSKLPQDLETIVQKMVEELERALLIFQDIYTELFQLEERNILPKGGAREIICHLSRTDKFGTLKGTSLEGGDLEELFQLENVLGEGAYSIVQKGHYKPLDKECAVKFLNHTTSLLFAKRFLAEGFLGYFISSKIRGEGEGSDGFKNLMEILDFGGLLPVKGDQAPFYFIVSEYVGGETLFSWVWKNRSGDGFALPSDSKSLFRDYLNISLQMVKAVRKLHSMGFVHGDINPLNFMINSGDSGPQIKVIDYGSILPIDSEPFEDHLWSWGSSQSKGAKRYRAPEHTAFFSEFPVEKRSRKVRTFVDIFSLGITLFDIFTEMKFAVTEDADPNEIKAEDFSPFKGASELREEVVSQFPRWLGQVFKRSVEFQPSDRISLEHLHNILDFAHRHYSSPLSLGDGELESFLEQFWSRHKITEELNSAYQKLVEEIEPEILATPVMLPNEYFQEQSNRYIKEIFNIHKKYKSAAQFYNKLDFIWDPEFDLCPNLLCQRERVRSEEKCSSCGVPWTITCPQCGEANSYFVNRCQNHNCRAELSPAEKVKRALELTVKYASESEDRQFELPSSVLKALITISIYREYLKVYLPLEEIDKYVQELKQRLFEEEERLQKEKVAELAEELRPLFKEVREKGLRLLRLEKYKNYLNIIREKIAERAYVDAIEIFTSIQLEHQKKSDSLPEEREIIEQIIREKDNLIQLFLQKEMEAIEREIGKLEGQRQRLEEQIEECKKTSDHYLKLEREFSKEVSSIERELEKIRELDSELSELIGEIEREAREKFSPDRGLLERLLKNPPEEPEPWESTPLFSPEKFSQKLNKILEGLNPKNYYILEKFENLTLPEDYRQFWGKLTAALDSISGKKEALQAELKKAIAKLDSLKSTELNRVENTYQKCKELFSAFESEVIKLGELVDKSQRKLGDLFRDDPSEYLPEIVKKGVESFQKNIEFVNTLSEKISILGKKK